MTAFTAAQAQVIVPPLHLVELNFNMSTEVDRMLLFTDEKAVLGSYYTKVHFTIVQQTIQQAAQPVVAVKTQVTGKCTQTYKSTVAKLTVHKCR